MTPYLVTILDKEEISDMLHAFHTCVGLPIQVIDDNGQILQSRGNTTSFCSLFHQFLPPADKCSTLHIKAARHAMELGETYIFSCHANLSHIVFPLINKNSLFGSILVGPFLMEDPDSTLISGIAERYKLTPAMSLELYDELPGVPRITPDKAGQLQKLVDHLLSPLIPGERAVMLQNQQKAYQQARINETIQVYKEQKVQPSLLFFHK